MVVGGGRVSYVDNFKLHVHSSLLHVVNIRIDESADRGILLIILRCLGTNILLRMGNSTLNHKITDYYIIIYTNIYRGHCNEINVVRITCEG